MKKFLFGAGSVLIALITNAASVTWTVTNIQETPGGTTPTTQWICYVLAGSTYDNFTLLSADKKIEYIDKNNLGTGTLTYQPRSEVYSVSIKEGSYEANETPSAYIVFFDAKDTASASYMAYTATGKATIGPTGADSSYAFGDFTNATATSGGWQSIPEPTSGLLMLLGMAGLALRRKQK